MKAKLLKSPVLVILIVTIMAYWPVAFMVLTFKWDMLDVVLPFRYFAGECIRHGVFPLWDPYILTGIPMYADLQVPLWSPEVWIIGLTTGYNIYVLHGLFIFYIFLAGFGMYRLIVSFTGHKNTALITGIAYMLSGFFVGHGQALFAIIGASFLPWVVLYMIKNCCRPTFYRALKLSLFLFLMISTGYQFISIITAYLLVAIFICFLIARLKDRSPVLPFLVYNITAIFTALLLCLVILVPISQAVSFNERLSNGLSLSQATVYPFTWQSLISLMIPFATVKYAEFFGTDISMRNMHLGLIMLILFTLALFQRKTRLQWVILIFGVICFLASLGDRIPVYKFLYHGLPFVKMLRMPAYFVLFTIFSMLVITGIHLPGILFRPEQNRKPLFMLFTLTIIVLCSLLVFSILHISFTGSPLRNLWHQPLASVAMLNFHEHLVIQAPIQILLLVILAILLKKETSANHFVKILPWMVAVEMVIAVNMNSYFTVLSEVSPGEINSFLKSQPAGFPIPENVPISENSDQKLTHSPLWRNMGILTKKISYNGFSSFILIPYNVLDELHPRLRDAVLNNPPVYLSGSIYGYSRLGLPAIHYNQGDLYLPDSVVAGISHQINKNFPEQPVRMDSFSPLKIECTYDNDANAFITLMQSDYPGWKTFLDGKEVTHYTSNFLYISTLAPAGKHVIRFEYHNSTVLTCFIISYSLLILVVIYLLISKKRFTRQASQRVFH